MEEVAKKYRDKAEFVFVYCREAHPEGEAAGGTRTKKNQPIAQATTPAERNETARQFCDDMRMTRRILLDAFDDESIQGPYGGLQNHTVVVDVEGKIALKLAWTDGK